MNEKLVTNLCYLKKSAVNYTEKCKHPKGTITHILDSSNVFQLCLLCLLGRTIYFYRGPVRKKDG